MGSQRQHPGDRIGDIQHEQRVLPAEDRKNPDHAEQAGAHERDQHGQHRIAQAAHAARDDVHHSAQAVGHADHAQAHHAILDDLGLARVNAEQVFPQEVRAVAQYQADDEHQPQAVTQHPVDALIILCAQVLAGKAQRGLIQRVHRGIDKALDVAGRRVARDRDRAERVDRRLDEHVGDVENHALQAGGQADLHDADKLLAVEVNVLQVDMADTVHSGQAHDDQDRRDNLRNDGRGGRAGHAPMEHDDKEQIAADVKNAREQQKVQRPARVADRTQDRRTKVIQHRRRHADEIQAHVKRCLVQHLCRGGHERQHRPRCHNAQHDQDAAADQAGHQCGLHGLAGVLDIPAAIEPRNQHICAN